MVVPSIVSRTGVGASLIWVRAASILSFSYRNRPFSSSRLLSRNAALYPKVKAAIHTSVVTKLAGALGLLESHALTTILSFCLPFIQSSFAFVPHTHLLDFVRPYAPPSVHILIIPAPLLLSYRALRATAVRTDDRVVELRWSILGRKFASVCMEVTSSPFLAGRPDPRCP